MSTEITLRSMKPSDADVVALLHATSWRSAYRGIVPDSFLDNDVFADRQAVWRERLQTSPAPSAFGIVAEDESGRMIGFAYVLPGHDPVCGTLVDNLHVHPELKGGGIGRKLLQAVVQDLGPEHSTLPLYLWVLDQNEPAKRFYARLGAEFIDPGMTDSFGGVRLPEWRCIWRNPSTLLADHA